MNDSSTAPTAANDHAEPLKVEMTAKQIREVQALGGTIYEWRHHPSSIQLSTNADGDILPFLRSDTHGFRVETSDGGSQFYPAGLFQLALFLSTHPDCSVVDDQGDDITTHLSQISTEDKKVECGHMAYPSILNYLDSSAGRIHRESDDDLLEMAFDRNANDQAVSLLVKLPVTDYRASRGGDASGFNYHLLCRPRHVQAHLKALRWAREHPMAEKSFGCKEATERANAARARWEPATELRSGSTPNTLLVQTSDEQPQVMEVKTEVVYDHWVCPNPSDEPQRLLAPWQALDPNTTDRSELHKRLAEYWYDPCRRKVSLSCKGPGRTAVDDDGVTGEEVQDSAISLWLHIAEQMPGGEDDKETWTRFHLLLPQTAASSDQPKPTNRKH